MGQVPNVGSVIMRVNAGDDTPAEADAVGTAACDIPKLPKSEGLRLEGLQLCAAPLL